MNIERNILGIKLIVSYGTPLGQGKRFRQERRVAGRTAIGKNRITQESPFHRLVESRQEVKK
ncbi:MAG: hypothetical protein NTY86_18135 [Deltaproteobacteria bacterium]|jgi:hypothetical protein|nr:hypothetical protein [Deltaproteobacteria bacterium]